jgi:hypothetical protein
VIKEPICLSQALLSDPRALHHDWLAALIRCLCARPTGTPGASFVKFTSWHVLHVARLRREFATVPCVFLYRDPVEILVSLVERPPAWRRELQAGLLPVACPAAASDEELYARTIAALYDAALATPDLHLVNYVELSQEMLATVAERLGARWTAEERERVAAASTRNSKSGAVFTPDGARKQAKASPAARAAVERFAAESYARLEQRRHSSTKSLGGEPSHVSG